MQFVSARELRLDPKGVWKKIQKGSMGVVTLNGKPCFLLTKLDPEELEEVLYIQNRIRAELALKRMRDRASEQGLDQWDSEKIDDVIRKTRQSRKK